MVRVAAYPQRSLRILRARGSLRLTVRCSEACRVNARGLRGARVVARGSSASLRTLRTLTLRVTRAELRRLATVRAATLVVRTTARDGEGNARSDMLRLRLRR
jgi:hypothetical protein